MTYAAFRRYCKEHPVELECIWRFGKDIKTPEDLPVPMRGRRRIMSVTSFGFRLAYGAGTPESESANFRSELSISGAKLFQLNGDILTIYNCAPRPATVEEQALLDAWEAKRSQPEFVQLEESDALSDGCCTYYAEKAFFASHKGGESLMKNRTYRIDPATKRELIWSKTNPGEPVLRYKVYGLNNTVV